MPKRYDESEGIWRTIAGRKVFIRVGQKLSEAMKESGKFPSYKANKDKRELEQIRNEKKTDYERAQDKYEHYKFDDNESEDKKKYKTAYDEAKEEYVKAEREYGEKLADDFHKKQTAKNIKGAKGTDENDSERFIAENNPNVKKPYKEARVDRYRSFDNGHILHEYYPQKGIQKKAKEASIENPNDIHYVAYDDIMDPSSSTRWYKGKPYTINEAGKINEKINARNNIKYLDKQMAHAVETDNLEDQNYYLKQIKTAKQQYKEKYQIDYDFDDDANKEAKRQEFLKATANINNKKTANRMTSENKYQVEDVYTGPKVRNTNVQFSTEQYQFAHGKMPKGKGGSWAFSTDREGKDIIFSPMGMTYTEAKKWAIQEMNRLGKKVTRLYVQS